MTDDRTPNDDTPDDETPEEGLSEEETSREEAVEEEATEEPATEEEAVEREEVAAEPAERPARPEISPAELDEEVPGRSPVGTVIAVIVGIAIIAIGIWFAVDWIKPEAGELLQETVAKYRDAQQIHVESTLQYDATMGEQTTDMSMPTTAWFGRPNQMYFETGPEDQKVLAVSDGENLYLNVAIFPGVMKLPAPATLAEMPLDRLSMSTGLGIPNLVLPDIASILSGAFTVAEGATVQYEIDAAEEWLSGLEAPDGTWTLSLTPENGPTVAIWIDKSERVIRKYATMVDFDDMMAASPGMEEQLESLPEERQQEIREMSTQLVADVETVELDQAAPEGTFAFEAPEGAEIVEANTIEEGIQKLMESMMGQQGMPTPEGEAAPDAEAPAEE